MNLLLLEPDEIGPGDRIELSDRRAEHLLRVLEVETGQGVRCGVLNGGTGLGKVVAVEKKTVELEVEITEPPPPPPSIDLVVALPRPQVLHRVLQFAASMGVGRLDLVNAWRVEKSFFSSPSLGEEKIRRQLFLGAEQGRIPRLPEVAIHKLLVPFVRGLGEDPDPPRRLVAHPGAPPIEEVLGSYERLQIAIGPEGGWIDREVETFGESGFEPVGLGPWVLRVEAALVAAVAEADLLRRSSARRDEP